MTIGARIKARRIELGLSQEELAIKIGYHSRSTINKIECDQRNLTQSKIKIIADALKTTPAFIMGWKEHSTTINVDDLTEEEVNETIKYIDYLKSKRNT